MACRRIRPSTGKFGDESRELERRNGQAQESQGDGKNDQGSGASRRGHGPVFIEQSNSSLLD
jgi:hypothetical protein